MVCCEHSVRYGHSIQRFEHPTKTTSRVLRGLRSRSYGPSSPPQNAGRIGKGVVSRDSKRTYASVRTLWGTFQRLLLVRGSNATFGLTAFLCRVPSQAVLGRKKTPPYFAFPSTCVHTQAVATVNHTLQISERQRTLHRSTIETWVTRKSVRKGETPTAGTHYGRRVVGP